jgi:hypothetical protein
VSLNKLTPDQRRRFAARLDRDSWWDSRLCTRLAGLSFSRDAETQKAIELANEAHHCLWRFHHLIFYYSKDCMSIVEYPALWLGEGI